MNDARHLVFAILFAATGGLGVGRAATIPVGAGDVPGLIAAITTANGNGVADVIDLAGGFYDITASDNTTADGPNGLPVITSDITINGHGATVRRTGAPAFRIVEVGSGGVLTLTAVTVSGGSAAGGNGAGGGVVLTGTNNALTVVDGTITGNSADVFGGGIAVRGTAQTVVLTRATVSGNTAVAGGGIQAQGTQVTLTLDHSRVSGNMAVADSQTVDGGGISISGGPLTITISDSVVEGNTASTPGAGSAQGGGISSSAEATYTIVRSTISNNHATSGAGVGAGGGFVDNGGAIVTMRNTTISGNTASGAVAFLGGGGIESDSVGTFTLNNVTIANNQAAQGGGIDVSAGSVLLQNSILADNGGSASAPDCAGALTSQGHNLIESTTGCTVVLQASDVTGQDPLLGSLGDNGGPTQTMALSPGSPAVEAGDAAVPGSGGSACEATDQRGLCRPGGAACDLGAFEAGASACGTTPTTTTSTTTLPAGQCAGVPTFEDIDCRLDMLIATVQSAQDLGRLAEHLRKVVTKARTQKQKAEQAFAAANLKKTKNGLKKAGHTMRSFVHSVKSRSGRKIIPPSTSEALLAKANPIVADLKSLLASL